MCAEKTTEALRHAMVYSTEWAKTTALKYLCGYSDTVKNIYVETVSDVRVLFSRLNETYSDVPDIIVLDIPARDYVGLLCHIRRLHPALPVIITQPRILFSDRAVASWFGHIWLREYDSLMAGYMSCTKRHDSLTFHLRFKRCILIDRTGENKPSVGMTFINPASQYITAGIAKSPAGKRQAAAVVKIVFNSSLLLHISVTGLTAYGLCSTVTRFP